MTIVIRQKSNSGKSTPLLQARRSSGEVVDGTSRASHRRLGSRKGLDWERPVFVLTVGLRGQGCFVYSRRKNCESARVLWALASSWVEVLGYAPSTLNPQVRRRAILRNRGTDMATMTPSEKIAALLPRSRA